MDRLTGQSTSTWAEDRATLRSDPSADPGAETEAWAVNRSPSFLHFGISTTAKNLRGTTPRPLGRMSPLSLTNPDRSTFQFPLNQDNCPRCPDVREKCRPAIQH
jgi:hypothetical protein